MIYVRLILCGWQLRMMLFLISFFISGEKIFRRRWFQVCSWHSCLFMFKVGWLVHGCGWDEVMPLFYLETNFKRISRLISRLGIWSPSQALLDVSPIHTSWELLDGLLNGALPVDWNFVYMIEMVKFSIPFGQELTQPVLPLKTKTTLLPLDPWVTYSG